MVIPAALAARLAPLVGKLGSPHDGEIVAAARALGRQLERHRLNFNDLAALLANGHAQEPQHGHRASAEPDVDPAYAGFASHLDAVRWLMAERAHRLSPKEYAFLSNMLHRLPHGRPSPKQAEWIVALVERYRDGQ